MAADITELLITKYLDSGETAVILLFRYVLWVDTIAIRQRLYLNKMTDKHLHSGANKSNSLVLQNKCGNKTGNFHVITENMPCGTTGTTCSKAVKILLGVRPQA